MVSSSVPVLGTHRRPHVLCQARRDADTRRARSNRVPLTLACHNATLVMMDCMTSWSYNPFFGQRRGDTPCHYRTVTAAPPTEKCSAFSSSTTTCRGHVCRAIGRGRSGRAVRGAAVKAVSPAKRGRSAATRLDGGEHTRTLSASTAPTYHNILWSTASEKPAHPCARQHLPPGRPRRVPVRLAGRRRTGSERRASSVSSAAPQPPPSSSNGREQALLSPVLEGTVHAQSGTAPQNQTGHVVRGRGPRGIAKDLTPNVVHDLFRRA